VRQEEELDRVRQWIANARLLLKISGCWFKCEMRPIHPGGEEPFDMVFKVRLAEAHAHEAYGKAMFCAEKRQLSRKELRQFGLRNSPCELDDSIHAAAGKDLLGRMRRSNGNPVRRQLRDIIGPVSRSWGLIRRTQIFSKMTN